MSQELRSELHAQLEAVNDEIGRMIEQVATGVVDATRAMLTGDEAEAARLTAADEEAVDVTAMIENELERCIATEAPVASELRFVLTGLRIAPQLERSIDLLSYVAQRAAIGPGLEPAVRDVLQAAGDQAGAMWAAVRDAWQAGDPEAGRAIDDADDHIDLLVSELRRLVAATTSDPLVAMECTLLGRFYERLGDHAVHVAERISWMVTGT